MLLYRLYHPRYLIPVGRITASCVGENSTAVWLWLEYTGIGKSN